MANPQLEDGHTRIANELIDRLVRVHLSPNQWQVLFFVIRKTYGYQKKADYITNSQIVQGTGIHKAHVSRAMSNLVGRHILTRQGKLIGLQKDHEAWLELPELATNVTQTGNNSPPEKLPDTQPKLPDTQPKLPKMATKVTSTLVTQKKKENIKETIKRKHGEFNNVLLTDTEYQELLSKLGEKDAKYWIEQVSSGKAAKGYKYKSDYAAILNWQRRAKEGNAKATGRGLPTIYTPTADYPDL